MLFIKERQDAEEGFLSLQVIVILSLFLALELSLFYSLSNIQSLNTVKNLSLKDSKEIAEKVGKNNFDISEINSLGKTEIYNFGNKESRSLEIFYKNKISPLSPSFEVLESLPSQTCPAKNKNLFSTYTCKTILPGSSYILGNLISNVREETFSKIIFIRGEVNLEELILSSEENEIYFISIGNIKINKLKLNNISKSKHIVIFSQTGKIEIDYPDDKLILGAQNKNSKILLTLVSSKLKKAANFISEKPGIFGSSFKKSQKLWPNEIIFASRVN